MTKPNSLRSAQDLFVLGPSPAGFTVGEFWQWGYSDLLDNTVRGVLAEFIVARALGCGSSCRVNWEAADLRLPSGLRVEVKAAAYRQSWTKGDVLSNIRFSIRPAYGWSFETNESSPEQRRNADLYVFCVLDNRQPTPLDPLDLTRWQFHVLPVRVLDERCPGQKTMGLATLQRLQPSTCSFAELAETVARVGGMNQAGATAPPLPEPSSSTGQRPAAL